MGNESNMGNEINMKQYGLSEAFVKSVCNFSDLTVARILSQEKGIYPAFPEHITRHRMCSG